MIVPVTVRVFVPVAIMPEVNVNAPFTDKLPWSVVLLLLLIVRLFNAETEDGILIPLAVPAIVSEDVSPAVRFAAVPLMGLEIVSEFAPTLNDPLVSIKTLLTVVAEDNVAPTLLLICKFEYADGDAGIVIADVP